MAVASAIFKNIKAFSFRYEVRMIIALVSVLSAAFTLQLHSPHWAAITLWVVSQPSRGMTLTKSWYRLLGTLIGGTAGIALVYVFNDQILWLSFVLALWIALCSYATHRLSYLKSYGAVLAALTAALLAIVVLEHRGDIYNVALSRLLSVCLGVTGGAIFSYWPGAKSNKLQLFDRLSETLNEFRAAHGRPEDYPLKTLNDRLVALDELLVYARLESQEVRLKYRLLQNIILHLFRCLSERSKWGFSESSDATESRSAANDSGSTQVEEASSKPARSGTKLSESNLRRIEKSKAAYLHELRWAEQALRSIKPEGQTKLIKLREIHFTDLRSAHYSALRSFVGVFVGGLMWYLTDWDLAAGIILIAALNCVLFASKPDPIQGMNITIKSSAIGYLAAGLSLALYALTGRLEFIYGVTALVLIYSSRQIMNPSTALAGSILGSNFLLFLSPHWPFSVSWQAYFNIGVGYFAGSSISWLLFQLIAPPSQQQQVFSLRKRAWVDFFNNFSPRYESRISLFESSVYAKFSRLMQISIESQSGATQTVRELFVLLQIWMKFSELPQSIKTELLPWVLSNQQLSSSSKFQDFEYSDRLAFEHKLNEWIESSSKILTMLMNTYPQRAADQQNDLQEMRDLFDEISSFVSRN